MAHVGEAYRDALRDLYHLAVAALAQVLRERGDVLGVVERFGLLAARAPGLRVLYSASLIWMCALSRSIMSASEQVAAVA